MIRFIKTVLFLIVGLLSASAQGQQGGRSSDKSLFLYPDAKFVRQQPDKRHVAGIQAAVAKEKQQIDPADTMSVALYRSKVKQHGWMRGLGKPISEEVASHLSRYYRFSKKNKAGHWTKIEYLNGYGKPESCGSTYLINPYDDDDKQLDEDWRDKLKEIVCWEYVGNNTGEQCVQENAYDKDGNLVLSYIPVRVGENKYMGHYIDAWGLPVSMRDKDGAKYVVIQWDANGYESDIMFIGDDGFFKKNNWGAYRSKYIHDKNGYMTQNMSANVDGNYMLDRAGNSGQLSVYDENGLETSVTNVDDHNRVCRIILSETADEDYIRKNYEYDEWGRDTCRRYVLADGITPDTTSDGVHAHYYRYDDKGNCTLIQYLGIDGKPVTDKRGYSSTRREFDKMGNETLFECRNSKGEFFNNKVCLAYYDYDDNGEMSLVKTYKTTNGRDTICNYYFHRDGYKRIYEYPEDDWVVTYIDDDEGNVVETYFTSLDGSPQENYKGYFKTTKLYSRKPGQSTIEECFYGLNEQLVDLSYPTFKKYHETKYLCNRNLAICDSINRLIIYQYYDGDRLLYSYQKMMGADNSDKLTMDVMGKQARNHVAEDGLYFDYYEVKNIYGGINYTMFVNEYGETSYKMRNDSNSPTVYAFNPYGESYYMDEKGNFIKNSSEFRKTLPQAYIIEVYDSIAVRLGIQSGDVIMEYGEWKYPELMNYNYNDNRLRGTTFMLQDTKKKMVVMRRNSQTNEAEVKEIMLGKGTLGDFGFYFYRIYCTQKEAERYKNAYQVYLTSQPQIKGKKAKDLKEDEYNTIFMRPYRSDGQNKNLYSRDVVDDAIIIALAIQDKNGRIHLYHHTDSVEVFDSCRFVDDRAIQRMWFTTDMRTIRSLDLEGEKSYWDAYFWCNKMDKRISKPCKPLYREAELQMEKYVALWQAAYKDSMQTLYDDAWQAVRDDSIIVRVVKVKEDDGYMARLGYKDRLFVALEWCDWTCLDAPETFDSVLDKYRYDPKHVVLLSVETKDDIDLFTDVVEINSDASMLGVGVRDIKLSYKYVKENILDKYKEWKTGSGPQLLLQHDTHEGIYSPAVVRSKLH